MNQRRINNKRKKRTFTSFNPVHYCEVAQGHTLTIGALARLMVVASDSVSIALKSPPGWTNKVLSFTAGSVDKIRNKLKK